MRELWQPIPWDRWTPPRVVTTVAWLASVAALAGLALLADVVSTLSLGGEPYGAGAHYLGAALGLASGLVLATGPGAVWYFRRRRVWLVLAVVALLLGASLAALDLSTALSLSSGRTPR